MDVNQRDELAALIESGYGKDESDCPYGHAPVLAEAILTAGYRKPRTITTVEELDALPLESIVRSDIGVTYEKDADVDEPDLPWWVSTGDSRMYPARRILLPATVLYEPGVSDGES